MHCKKCFFFGGIEMKDFDLQLFDDDVAENSGESASENSSTESITELPEGFEGLEEFKDDILNEINDGTQSENSDETPEVQNTYQSKDEEIFALKRQIEEMKKQGRPAQPQTQVQQPVQAQSFSQPQSQSPPPIQVTPEFMSAYKQATHSLALQMARMTEKDLKELEFADDDDPKLQQWQLAQKLAADKVQADIRQIRQNQAIQAQRYMSIRNAAVQNYNEYTVQELKEPDFENVKKFAVDTLFKSLPVHIQHVLADSYNRIQTNQATPTEIMLVQNYYAQAKAIYRKQKSNPKNNQAARNEAGKLPKIDNLNGAGGNSGDGYSVRDLERLIDATEDFEKLDPKIRKMFEY